MRLGQKHSVKTREQMSITRKGKPNGKLGIPHSLNTKLKLSIIQKKICNDPILSKNRHNFRGIKRLPHHTTLTREKIREGLINHWSNTENRRKASEKAKERWSLPQFYSKMMAIFQRKYTSQEWAEKSKLSQQRRYQKPEEREKQRAGQLKRYADKIEHLKSSEKAKEIWAREGYKKKRSGENHPLWKGETKMGYPTEFNKTIKEYIRNRDNYKCQICGKSELENGESLSVHHIDSNKKNLRYSNLISHCRSCHTKTFWDNIFASSMLPKKESNLSLVIFNDM